MYLLVDGDDHAGDTQKCNRFSLAVKTGEKLQPGSGHRFA